MTLMTLGPQEIASQLNESRGDDFEKAVQEAFEYLDFNSQWIGTNAGDADVLVTSRRARVPYRLVCECCAVNDGNEVTTEKVSQIMINGPQHKENFEYFHLVVVGRPQFSKIAIRNAGSDVCLLPAEGLAQLVLCHESFEFSNDDLHVIFLPATGLASVAVEKIINEYTTDFTNSFYSYAILVLAAEKFATEQGGGSIRIQEDILISTARAYGEALGLRVLSFDQIQEGLKFLSTPMANIFHIEQESITFRGIDLNKAFNRLGWIAPYTLSILNDGRLKLDKSLQKASKSENLKDFPF